MLDLTQPWETYNIGHELTTKGLDKFVADYQLGRHRSADVNALKKWIVR